MEDHAPLLKDLQNKVQEYIDQKTKPTHINVDMSEAEQADTHPEYHPEPEIVEETPPEKKSCCTPSDWLIWGGVLIILLIIFLAVTWRQKEARIYKA